MMTKDDISPGSLVRFNAAARANQTLGLGIWKRRGAGVGVLIGFDHFGRVNPDKGDPLVLWAGETKPCRMAGSALEIVS